MLIWPLRKVYMKLCQLSADTIHTDIYISDLCNMVQWMLYWLLFHHCGSTWTCFWPKSFFVVAAEVCFFLSLQRISRLALEWIKFKITWEYHWSVDLNRKTGKKHHEHGGLLCFIAVNSACVMTKELSSFWIKGSRFVLEPQTINWLL